MALLESTKLMIQKRISQEIGLEVSVKVSEETGDIELCRLVKVTRKPMNSNQIELSEARSIDPKVKIGDNIELPLEEESDMIKYVIDKCLNEAIKAEESLRRKQELIAELVNNLKVKGVIEYSLIFAVFEHETIIGDAIFKYDNKYEVRVEHDRRIQGDKFEVGKEYPMIILSFEERQDTIIIQASRVTNSLVGELVRMSLVNCNTDVDIKKVFRTPGKLARVVVDCDDPNLNPSGVVVGFKGSRVKSVESYLSGEKVEIINYAPCTPLQIRQIVGDALVDLRFYFENPSFFQNMKTANKKRAVLVIKDDQVSRVIGKEGVALGLTNRIVGWVLHVMSESDFKEKFPNGFQVNPVDFDWSGAEIGDEILDRYFGYYLSKLSPNLVGCCELNEEALEKVSELTQDDKTYILNYIDGLSFMATCPVCGADIPATAHICQHCGAEFEV